ncbi:hypothetical protein HAX54_025583 [Datura stramonium]|uniref:Uncharacterized protein n=1 Tax=Datura stramonium TaxID=4076 RepID=A0ABS8S7Q7_DATST|nr:hypothetical protein [Datura stramonium]
MNAVSCFIELSINLQEPSDLETMEFPDHLDVLLAERRVDEALLSLDEGDRIASEAKEKKTLGHAVLLSLQTAIAEPYQKYQFNMKNLVHLAIPLMEELIMSALSQLVSSGIA